MGKRDILHLLEIDHRVIEEYLNTAVNGKTRVLQEQALVDLHEEIEAHSAAEEAVVYPKLEERSKLRRMLITARKEHREQQELLEELEMRQPGDEGWDQILDELRIAIEHHFGDEECRLYPCARQLLGGKELFAMGRKYTLEKLGDIHSTLD